MWTIPCSPPAVLKVGIVGLFSNITPFKAHLKAAYLTQMPQPKNISTPKPAKKNEYLISSLNFATFFLSTLSSTSFSFPKIHVIAFTLYFCGNWKFCMKLSMALFSWRSMKFICSNNRLIKNLSFVARKRKRMKWGAKRWRKRQVALLSYSS